jgi:putative transposase
MERYRVVDRKDRRKLVEFLAGEGQVLSPLLGLIEAAELGLNELIDVVGRAGIEALLELSAREVAGPKQKGKRREDRAIRWYGRQGGRVQLAERKVRVDKPRLRRKGKGKDAEVAVPVYAGMQSDGSVAERVLSIVLSGVSTRRYAEVLPAMAESVGMSRSSVSREAVDACEATLRAVCERRFDDVPLLVIYIDGIQRGGYHVIVAVGVDEKGYKHLLGLREGATENGAVVTALLEDLVDRGVRGDRHYLFVIDGSKALRAGIRAVYGRTMPVQRCRPHKERNVRDHLPKPHQAQVASAMKAAWKLPADEGVRQLEDLARWLEREHPSAAQSLREGLEEMFTINRMNLSLALRRCLGSTNVIESSLSGNSEKTGHVRRWRDGAMVVRWVAAGLVATEKHFRKVMGYRDLWELQAHLHEMDVKQGLVRERKVG